MVVRRLIQVVSLISAVLVGTAVAPGCYKPSILDGALHCGPNNSCPDGFQCVSDRCHRRGVDGSASDSEVSMKPDTQSEAPVDTSTDAPDATDGCVPRTAPAGCTPQSDSTCDPVCQTRCCTSQKCSAVYNGEGPSANTGFRCFDSTATRRLGERCDVQGAATQNRQDNCAPGLICVEGNVGNYCLQLCRGDGDCAEAGTRCEPRTIELAKAANSVSVCGLAPTTCDPTLNAASAGCPANLVCYLVESNQSQGDKTVCEIRSGETPRNLSCSRSRDCLAGLTCPTSGPGAGICRPVCSRAATPDSCPPGTTCQASGATYDFCF